MTTPDALKRRQQATNRLLTVILVLFALTAGYQFFVVNPTTSSNRKALCAFRANTAQHITQEQAFLAHPEQFPQFDDPKVIAMTQAQLRGDEQTVDAFGDLNC